MDPQVAIFARLREPASSATGRELPWAHLSSKRPHSHDVRAMAVAGGRHLPEGPRLYTGSNDTQLLSHSVELFQKVGGRSGRVGGWAERAGGWVGG